jgi:rhodanese-related sulfurtransferase
MKHININTFKEVIDSESSNETVDFINVCTPAEYKEKHIKGVRNVPLDTLDSHVAELNEKSTVYIHCRSGNRGKKAIEKLVQLGVTAELVNVEGGLLAWQEAGLETGSLTNRMPLMRQVLLAAGSLIIIGFIGTQIIHESFQYIIPAVGAGLMFSGLTGWCGMATLLAKMPWNK